MTASTSAIAVDIVLQPDATMVDHAEDANVDLLAVYPEGFPLDEKHRPHVTVLQCYVDAALLDEFERAVGAFLAAHPVSGWTLQASGFYYLPFGDLGVAGIVIEPTPELLATQGSLVELSRPYVVASADGTAFVTTAAEPEINQPTLDYVAGFAQNASGVHYNPHVTTGVAPRKHLDDLVAAPFSSFTFSPVGAALYQLGNLGTAARLLHDWSPETPGPIVLPS